MYLLRLVQQAAVRVCSSSLVEAAAVGGLVVAEERVGSSSINVFR